MTGRTCTRCDRTLDPHYRHGVPCYQARAHAELTVRSYWGGGATWSGSRSATFPPTCGPDHAAPRTLLSAFRQVRTTTRWT
ncbi:hypothetical protein GCM10020001_118030 [Nonomuraea salmonea]